VSLSGSPFGALKECPRIGDRMVDFANERNVAPLAGRLLLGPGADLET